MKDNVNQGMYMFLHLYQLIDFTADEDLTVHWRCRLCLASDNSSQGPPAKGAADHLGTMHAALTGSSSTRTSNCWPKVPDGWTYEEMCAWAYDHDAHGNLSEKGAFKLTKGSSE